MLKARVIISLCIEDGVLMRTKRFRADYRYTQAHLAIEAVDEVFLVDITRSGPSAASRRAMAAYAERCFAPVTMGGWVSSVADARDLFALGADKVVVGRAGVQNPAVLREIAWKYGTQAVVAACDVESGLVRRGKMGHAPAQWAAEAEKSGAGEVFFQSIDRDGSLLGYDLAVLREIVAAVNCPVVVGGGCGGFQHMIEGFRAGSTGCVTSNIFHMTEPSLVGFKTAIARAGIPVREAA